MYPDPYTTNNTFWTVYLIFGIGCLVFFFFGVCALLCCCRERFRGMTRKGYVIREPEPISREPLIIPAMAYGQPGFAGVAGTYPPGQPPQYTPPYTDNPPQAPPAPYVPPKY